MIQIKIVKNEEKSNKIRTNSDLTVMFFLYSYFEKGCRKSARDNPEMYCGWF